jgi:hypothetical protein
VAALRPFVTELQAKVGLAVIGNGAPSFARGFREKMDVPSLLILSDEERISYKLAEWFPRTKLVDVPKTIARGLVTFWKHPQTTVEGDANQLGGAMVILPSGEVTYRYRSKYAGDHPAMSLLRDEALKAAK